MIAPAVRLVARVPTRRSVRALAVAAACALCAPAVHATPLHSRTDSTPDPFRYERASRISMPPGAYAVAIAREIPSFSRQTKLACSACHYGFPELTPFGRLFKLNGYTLTGLVPIEARDSARRTLELAPIPPAAAMLVTSVTHVAKNLPGAQNNDAEFPDQFSLFLSGEITPNLGAFTQVTYSAADGSISVDNMDFRFANRTTLAGEQLLYGVTLHNNPTVQDVWNTAPAWTFPFVSSGVAPAPGAGALIDGALAQQVVGLGAYGLWNNLVYAEVTAYRNAQQGGAHPADSTSTGVTHGLVPYWRVGLQHRFGMDYLMVGTSGLVAREFLSGVGGPAERFADAGIDAQYEHPMGAGVLIGRAAWMHERQSFVDLGESPLPVANSANTLDEFRINASYMPSVRFDFTLGYFSVSGSRDTVLYAPAPVTGSFTGRPNSAGGIGEFDFNAWQNTRLGVQYVAYWKFNGSSGAYDGSGRSASDNNNLYLFVWLAF